MIRRAHLLPAALAALASAAAFAAEDAVWIEAEDFSEKGAWAVDTQFTHAMGSAYLIAPGVLSPIGAAETGFRIVRAARYAVWARTRDWVPAHHPGRFALRIDGVRLGRTLGESGRTGWTWETCGEVNLAAGEHRLALEDLSGAFARCDAVLIVPADGGLVPSDDPAGTERLRARLAPQPPESDRGEFDVVVAGAGPAGVCAAVAAARAGARTALVHDRPVAGGNCSDEIGIGTDGAANHQMNMRESGLVEEWNLIDPHRRGRRLSDAAALLLAGETNLSVFANERIVGAAHGRARIDAVLARNTLTGARSRVRGRMFVDATGDGWVGYYAGAAYRMGREASAEFGEPSPPAPARADALTMSGCLYAYRYEMRPREVPYAPPPWADVLPEGFDRKPPGIGMPWWLEHPNDLDDLRDPEEARDMLLRYIFGYWGWLKNRSPLRGKARNAALVRVPFVNGRRESRRLEGDVIVTANDLIAGRLFDDRVAYGGWGLDVHDVRGMDNPHGDGWAQHPIAVPIYTIPFRALYSRNVDNLLMAGRCISVTHLALGSTRVGATCATEGQAAGTAAALCARAGLTPRALGATRIRELQQALLREDQYVPGVVNEDPADLARGARASASSSVPTFVFTPPRWGECPKDVPDAGKGLKAVSGASPACVVDGVSRAVGMNAHAWVSSGRLPQWIRLDLPRPARISEARITFDSDLSTHNTTYYAPFLAKDYRLEALCGGEWRTLAEERGNVRRLRVHRFAPVEAEAVRVTVTAVHGGETVRIFEIRLY